MTYIYTETHLVIIIAIIAIAHVATTIAIVAIAQVVVTSATEVTQGIRTPLPLRIQAWNSTMNMWVNIMLK